MLGRVMLEELLVAFWSISLQPLTNWSFIFWTSSSSQVVPTAKDPNYLLAKLLVSWSFCSLEQRSCSKGQATPLQCFRSFLVSGCIFFMPSVTYRLLLFNLANTMTCSMSRCIPCSWCNCRYTNYLQLPTSTLNNFFSRDYLIAFLAFFFSQPILLSALHTEKVLSMMFRLFCLLEQTSPMPMLMAPVKSRSKFLNLQNKSAYLIWQ